MAYTDLISLIEQHKTELATQIAQEQFKLQIIPAGTPLTEVIPIEIIWINKIITYIGNNDIATIQSEVKASTVEQINNGFGVEFLLASNDIFYNCLSQLIEKYVNNSVDAATRTRFLRRVVGLRGLTTTAINAASIKNRRQVRTK